MHVFRFSKTARYVRVAQIMKYDMRQKPKIRVALFPICGTILLGKCKWVVGLGCALCPTARPDLPLALTCHLLCSCWLKPAKLSSDVCLRRVSLCFIETAAC